VPTLSDLPIRLLTPRDLGACADLAEDRGWARDEDRWGLLLAAGTGYGIDDPDGGLVATCVVTCFGPHDEPDLAAIGMVLVAARHARRGIGRRLMRHVVDASGDTPLTLHATQVGRPLYEELGFTSIGRAELVRGHFVPDGAPAPVAIRPGSADDLAAMLRLDAEVFGADRAGVLAHLPDFADLIRLAEDADGHLIGFAAAWPSADLHVIGPLVARDTATAKALVAAVAASSDRPLRTDIDDRHAELLAWVKERGLETVRVNTMMTYGIPDLPGDWTRRFAPLTLATG
jgi:GNAT superfamily N-acetyltransferase